MKHTPRTPAPSDGENRKSIEPVVCYPIDTLPAFDPAPYEAAKQGMELEETITVAPRDASIFTVPAGHFFRITCPDGPQVGDLNLWNADDLEEKFYSGKTRALHGTHVSTGDRLWSNLPYLRPLATITHDTLDWYGWDEFGGSVHDVIGTRCDPYTNVLLSGDEYHHCCHSNLTRALATYKSISLDEAEPFVHDVLNVFMCTGFTQDTHQYFMKASPVRKGDYLEFFAEQTCSVRYPPAPAAIAVRPTPAKKPRAIRLAWKSTNQPNHRRVGNQQNHQATAEATEQAKPSSRFTAHRP